MIAQASATIVTDAALRALILTGSGERAFCAGADLREEEALDAGGFVWAEIESRARRVLWEVHTLASAYGWSESESLALGDRRRAVYLEMVHA